MADPRIENGFVRVPNELLEAIIKCRLSGLQKDIVWCIIRQTDGFNKPESKLSVRFIAKKINSSPARVSEALKVLIDKNIATVVQDYSTKGMPRVITLNKDYETWESNVDLGKCSESEGKKPDSPVAGNAISADSGNKINKDYKENLNNAQEFELFWKEYPRKVAKKKASAIFSKLKLGDETFNKLMGALREQKLGWVGRELKYIPHPSTWLNGERWNDELTISSAPALDLEIDPSETVTSERSYVQKQLSLMEENHAE